jgi:hypothetical protein
MQVVVSADIRRCRGMRSKSWLRMASKRTCGHGSNRLHVRKHARPCPQCGSDSGSMANHAAKHRGPRLALQAVASWSCWPDCKMSFCSCVVLLFTPRHAQGFRHEGCGSCEKRRAGSAMECRRAVCVRRSAGKHTNTPQSIPLEICSAAAAECV